MKTKTTIDADTASRLQAMVNELGKPLTADAASIRRLHDIAKELHDIATEIKTLADSLGRHKLVDFADVWPESLDPKEEQRMLLPLYLGMTPQDEKLVIDLARMPHLLIGGASGQGKSNLLNCIISGLARLLPPEQLRFFLFDPKYVEFTHFLNLPHLAFQVINDGAKCVRALNWLENEMEERLKTFSNVKCSNIEKYRAGGNQMPYIVVVIDEIADLMMEYGKEVESLVGRITAFGRAVGIHFVMATQVADQKVLTESLCRSFITRIAFKTRNQSESQLIIDAPDADILCGRGDMFVSQPGGSLVRTQCAYLSSEEEARIGDEIGKRYPHVNAITSFSDI